MSNVIVHVINVGQGDCFLVQVEGVIITTSKKNYLIDGGNGNKEHMANLIQCLTETSLITTEVGKSEIKLDYIIATHPDEDHFKGLEKLLDEHKYHGKVLITKDFFKKDTAEYFLQKIQESHKVLQILDTENKINGNVKWYFPKAKGVIAHNLQQKPEDSPSRTLESLMKDMMISAASPAKPQPLAMSTKPKPKKSPATNDTSILTVVNKTCVFTGDSNGDLITKHVLEDLIHKRIKPHFQIFQVPHHGSKINSKITELDIRSQYYGLGVDEDQALKRLRTQVESVSYNKREITETLNCAEFYCLFTADYYLISGGGHENYDHPNAEVLQGIIIARMIQRKLCYIVVTNSQGLDAKKLENLKIILPQEEWSVFVKIIHINDLKTDPPLLCTIPQQSHVTIETGPDHKEMKRHKQSLIEWSPQGYKTAFDKTETISNPDFHRLSIPLKCIRMPVPHKPWIGKEVNICYRVPKTKWYIKIQRTITKVSYTMFRYLDDEWKMETITYESSLPEDPDLLKSLLSTIGIIKISETSKKTLECNTTQE